MACRIVILGGPGAGKGTQARRLAKAFGMAHISTGDIFRSHVDNKTEVGRKIEEYMKSGKLLPDGLACGIVARRLAEADCRDGYVLDGFPRSIPQARELERLLAERGEALDLALNLDVTDDEIVERVADRWTCPVCGRIYNVKSKPPARKGLCDRIECAGAALIHRDDDTEDVIRRRLEVYHQTTEPIIAFYREKELLDTVGGADLSADEVTRRIEAVLRARKKL